MLDTYCHVVYQKEGNFEYYLKLHVSGASDASRGKKSKMVAIPPENHPEIQMHRVLEKNRQ